MIRTGSLGASGSGSRNLARFSRSFLEGAARRSPIPDAYLRAISAARRKSSSLLDSSFSIGLACVAMQHLPQAGVITKHHVGRYGACAPVSLTRVDTRGLKKEGKSRIVFCFELPATS